jgi:hypothetical protein
MVRIHPPEPIAAGGARSCSSAARAPVLHTGWPGFESRHGYLPRPVAGHTGGRNAEAAPPRRGAARMVAVAHQVRAPGCGPGGGTVRVRPVTLMRARRRGRVGPARKAGALWLRGSARTNIPLRGSPRDPASALVAQRKERDVPNVEAAGSSPVKGTLARSAAGPGRRPRGVPGGAPRLQNG